MTGVIEQHDFDSTAVGDTYRLFVRLPPGYDTNDAKYPVVVQLDANTDLLQEFDVTAGFASDLEAAAETVPTIVVGIGYPYNAYMPGKGRSRDDTLPMRFPEDGVATGDTGGAPQFETFLRTELTPWMEAHYRVDGPMRRALFGHSLGGLFAAWAFTRHEEQAPLFGTFVAASPSLYFDRGGMFVELEALKARTSSRRVKLQVTDGELEGPVMTVYTDEFLARVRGAQFEGLTVESHRYRSDHLGTVSPSFEAGLRFAFPAESP